MTTRWARFARGWIAAIVSLFVAACSHALAGGELPAAVGLALCLAFSGAVCVLLAGTTLSLVRLSFAVGLSQLLFHGLFSLLTTAPSGSSVAAAPGMHHGVMTLQLGASQLRSSGTGSMSMGSATMGADADVRMWVGHAIGALVTIAALSLGERAFWGMLRLARLCISHLLDPVAPVVASLRAAPVRRAQTPAAVIPSALVFSIHRHRGPPRVATLP